MFDARQFLVYLVSGDTLTACRAGNEAEAGNIRPCDLSERWYEWWSERAAIREYCGEQPREHAEAEALKETIAAMKRDHHSARLVFDN